MYVHTQTHTYIYKINCIVVQIHTNVVGCYFDTIIIRIIRLIKLYKYIFYIGVLLSPYYPFSRTVYEDTILHNIQLRLECCWYIRWFLDWKLCTDLDGRSKPQKSDWGCYDYRRVNFGGKTDNLKRLGSPTADIRVV